MKEFRNFNFNDDDEAASWCFHLFLSHTRTIACYTVNFFASISSFTLSIHFFGCFPWFLSPLHIDIAGNAFVRFPFLIHARTNLVFALLFCQPVSFLDIEYHAQSHFSSHHVLLLSTSIVLAMSFPLWGFVFRLLFSITNILSRIQRYWNSKVSYNFPSTLHHVPQKTIPNIFDCNLKKGYQILVIFHTNIPDTAGHQTTVQFPTSPEVWFCTTWGNLVLCSVFVRYPSCCNSFRSTDQCLVDDTTNYTVSQKKSPTLLVVAWRRISAVSGIFVPKKLLKSVHPSSRQISFQS